MQLLRPWPRPPQEGNACPDAACELDAGTGSEAGVAAARKSATEPETGVGWEHGTATRSSLRSQTPLQDEKLAGRWLMWCDLAAHCGPCDLGVHAKRSIRELKLLECGLAVLPVSQIVPVVPAAAQRSWAGSGAGAGAGAAVAAGAAAAAQPLDPTESNFGCGALKMIPCPSPPLQGRP